MPISTRRLLAREQDFVQALARPDAGEGDVDVAAGLEPGEPDDALGELHDLHRLAHIQHIDRNIRSLSGPSAWVAAVTTRSHASRMVMK